MQSHDADTALWGRREGLGANVKLPLRTAEELRHNGDDTVLLRLWRAQQLLRHFELHRDDGLLDAVGCTEQLEDKWRRQVEGGIRDDGERAAALVG
eukprot:3534283-Pleurochrysis_carterae.AAC.1